MQQQHLMMIGKQHMREKSCCLKSFANAMLGSTTSAWMQLLKRRMMVHLSWNHASTLLLTNSRGIQNGNKTARIVRSFWRNHQMAALAYKSLNAVLLAKDLSSLLQANLPLLVSLQAPPLAVALKQYPMLKSSREDMCLLVNICLLMWILNHESP